MAVAALYDRARMHFLQGDLQWKAAGHTFRCFLVQASQYGLAVTAATNATPIQITTAAHGLTTGDRVLVSGVGGNTAANGIWSVTVVNATQFTLDTSAGNGIYTSGGTVIKLSLDEFLSDIPTAARAGNSGSNARANAPSIGSLTSALGVAGGANIAFTAVPAGVSYQFLVIFRDDGVADTSSQLVAIIENATGLPITSNGADINVTWNTGANKIFKL